MTVRYFDDAVVILGIILLFGSLLSIDWRLASATFGAGMVMVGARR